MIVLDLFSWSFRNKIKHFFKHSKDRISNSFVRKSSYLKENIYKQLFMIRILRSYAKINEQERFYNFIFEIVEIVGVDKIDYTKRFWTFVW